MPDPPAYLDIDCRDLEKDKIDRVKELVSDSEFYLDDQMDVAKREYIFHISPFEKNEANDAAVVQFKNKIESELSGFSVSLDRNSSDPSHYGDFGYRIQIGDNSDEQKADESRDGTPTLKTDYDSGSDPAE